MAPTKPELPRVAAAESHPNLGVHGRTQDSENAKQELAFVCPRHRVACDCSAQSGEVDGAIEPLVQSYWATEAERSAVMRKLTDCNIKTIATLRRILQTNMWSAKVPRSCWHRGAPPLLNELLNERGSKLFKAATLEVLAARCCKSSHEQRDVERLLRKLCSDDGEMAKARQVLEGAGVTSVADLRTVLVVPKKDLGMIVDVREELDAVLGVGEGGTRRVDKLLTYASANDAGMGVVVSCASDGEGEAKQMKERLKGCGLSSPKDLSLSILTTLAEVHPAEFCSYGEATVVNEILRRKYGQTAMIKEKTLHRLVSGGTVNVIDGGGLLFTAPHGIWLQREGHPHHKPEVFTTFIATSISELIGASCCTWSNEERNKSEFLSRPDRNNYDPNYAPGACLNELPWFRALMRHARRFRGVRAGVLHVDIHGRRDVIHIDGAAPDESDCDIGVGALRNMRESEGDAKIANHLFGEIKWRLEAAFEGRGFKVSTNPRLTGYIGGERVPSGGEGSVDGARVYNTMTMQSVLLGTPAVQLELSLRMRRELRHDDQLRVLFAEAISAAARSIGHSNARY